MTQRSGRYDRTLRERSGWLIPLAVFIVTAALSAFFLALYLAPTPTSLIEEHPSPTPRTDRVRLRIGGLTLAIPANYLPYANAQQGGDLKLVELYTKYPGFQGFSEPQSKAFAGSSVDSPIIYILIRKDRFNLDEAERLQRIYMSYVALGAQRPSSYGLMQYAFRDDSGYRNEDLFVGNTAHGPVVMRCVRFSTQVTNPSCVRDVALANGVVLSYRFKRAYLPEWRQLAQGVMGLVRSFILPEK